jgi:hypothetical protein
LHVASGLVKAPSLITVLLGIATIGFFSGATVNTVAWVRCTEFQGGDKCLERQSTASSSWTSFGSTFLALVTNVIREQQS